jgi:hypothetical protein
MTPRGEGHAPRPTSARDLRDCPPCARRTAHARLAQAVDGVLAVHSELDHDVDDTSDWATHDPAA